MGEGGELQPVLGEARGDAVPPPPGLTAGLARRVVAVSAASSAASGVVLQLREHPAQAGRGLATGITNPFNTEILSSILLVFRHVRYWA